MARVPNDSAPPTAPEAEEPRGGDERQGDGEGQEGTQVSAHAPLRADKAWDELALPDATGLTVFRMSGLGGDLSSLVAGALGIEGTAPPWLQGYLDEGVAAESQIVEMFCEQFAKRRATFPELAKLAEEGVIAGYNPVEQQVQVWLRLGTRTLVRGHCDEIVCINPEGKNGHSFAVLEVKKFRPTLWNILQKNRGGDPFKGDPILEKYGWQTSALHHATKLPVYFVAAEFDPERGELTGKLEVILITSDGKGDRNVAHSKAEITARTAKALKHVTAGEVPMCDRADDSCFYAAFDFCPGKEKKSDVAIDTDDTDLGRLLGLYYAYSVDMQPTDDQKDAEKNRKKVKDQIDKHIAEKGYARSKGTDEPHVFRVWDEAGNEYEYEWVQYEIKARGATSGNKLNVKLMVENEATNPEDHPE